MTPTVPTPCRNNTHLRYFFQTLPKDSKFFLTLNSQPIILSIK